MPTSGPTSAPSPATPTTPPTPVGAAASTALPQLRDMTLEVNRELRKLWEERLMLHTGVLTKETRAAVQKILSPQVLLPLEQRPSRNGSSIVDDDAQRKILEKILAQHTGIYPYIRPNDYKKASLEVHDATTGISRKLLTDLVSDPESKEAGALAWFFENYVTGANRLDASKVFDTVNEAELKNAHTLVKMQTLYNQIIENEEYGELGTTDPSPNRGDLAPPFTTRPSCSAAATGKMGKVQLRKLEADQMSHVQSHIPGGKGNPAPFYERVNNAETELRQLEQKKRTLCKELTSLNALNLSLSIVPLPADFSGDIQRLSEDFLPSDLDLKLRDSVKVGRTIKTTEEWIKDTGLKSTTDAMTETFRQVGTRNVPAKTALHSLLKKLYGPKLFGMNPEEQNKFYAELEEAILSTEGSSAIQHATATPASAGLGSDAAHSTPAGAPADHDEETFFEYGTKTAIGGIIGGSLGALAFSATVGGVLVGGVAGVGAYAGYRLVRASFKALQSSKIGSSVLKYFKEPISRLGGKNSSGGGSHSSN